jgi:hypothetical protein
MPQMIQAKKSSLELAVLRGWSLSAAVGYLARLGFAFPA